MDTVGTEWTVEIRANFPKIKTKIIDFGGGIFNAEYKINSTKRYDAVRDCLKTFIHENNLPFRPYELMIKYRNYVDIRCKCSVDDRIISRRIGIPG